jgi:glutathione S-transferase
MSVVVQSDRYCAATECPLSKVTPAPRRVCSIRISSAIKGAQREAAYRAVNPMMALPVLSDGEGPILFKSLAIIEYLDETHPNPPLLPRDARGRARVRGLAQIVACDSHPLIVPRVREYLEREFKLDEPTRIK